MIVTKNIFFVFFLSVVAFQSYGQVQDISNLRASKLKKMSADVARYGDYYTTLYYYEAYAAKKPKNVAVQYQLAALYEQNRDYKSAADAYLAVYEMDRKHYQALYDHIRMVKMLGKFNTARVKFETFSSIMNRKLYHKDWKNLIDAAIESCDQALQLMEDKLTVEIYNIGHVVNGPHEDFSPIPLSDSELVFASLRESEINYYDVDSITKRRQLYISIRDDEVWGEPQLWDVPFNSPEFHVVNGSFNDAGDLFVCTRCQENWKRVMTCKLWMIRKDNGNWLPAELLPNAINGGGTVVTQPAFAYDQRQNRDLLYFSSNASGGLGGMDLYYSYVDKENNTWSKSVNLGAPLNGEGDEITPYFNQKEKKLYFSSSSLSGMGGFDVFYARGELGDFSSPQNVGYPINSSVDDFYYVLNEDRESGYFVSNRVGGYQMINETCCDDIYEFKLTDVIHIEMEGFVMSVEEEDYLQGESDKLSIQSFNTNFLDNVQIDIYLMEKGIRIYLERIVTEGDGTFKIDLEPENRYEIVLSKPGYFINNVDLDTYGITESVTMQQNIGMSEMSNRSIVLGNINYEFDSAELTQEARDVIDKGILNTLRENPKLIIEISAHTDNRGRDTYNQDLSERRAKSVVTYLTNKGIDADRLRSKGYGESKPIAPNTNPDGSDNPEGRAENRRTEFKILETLNIPGKD